MQLLIEKPDNPIGFIMEYLTKKYPEKISGTATVKSEKDSRVCTEMVTPPVIASHQETRETPTCTVSEASCSPSNAILERNAMPNGKLCPEEHSPCELQLP